MLLVKFWQLYRLRTFFIDPKNPEEDPTDLVRDLSAIRELSSLLKGLANTRALLSSES